MTLYYLLKNCPVCLTVVLWYEHCFESLFIGDDQYFHSQILYCKYSVFLSLAIPCLWWLLIPSLKCSLYIYSQAFVSVLCAYALTQTSINFKTQIVGFMVSTPSVRSERSGNNDICQSQLWWYNALVLCFLQSESDCVCRVHSSIQFLHCIQCTAWRDFADLHRVLLLQIQP